MKSEIVAIPLLLIPLISHAQEKHPIEIKNETDRSLTVIMHDHCQDNGRKDQVTVLLEIIIPANYGYYMDDLAIKPQPTCFVITEGSK